MVQVKTGIEKNGLENHWNKKQGFYVCMILIVQVFFIMRADAQNNGIVVSGNWIASVDAGHLEYGPGSDLNGNIGKRRKSGVRRSR